ncbi:MAG: hypothetical protein LBL48_08860 [Azoarcus sp.]|nr:hypothetical protein [Azoarcus sp.]
MWHTRRLPSVRPDLDLVFQRRRFIGLFLTCLLLAMQALWLVHHFEHDLGVDGNEDAACEFCCSMHGMGSALSGAGCAVVAIPLSESLAWDEPASRGDADPVQPRQQGPPRLS